MLFKFTHEGGAILTVSRPYAFVALNQHGEPARETTRPSRFS
jgi:hypothetical protein